MNSLNHQNTNWISHLTMTLQQLSAKCKKRPDTEPSVGTMDIDCAGAIAIDTIALALGVIGLRGSAQKTVGRNMYKRLPRSRRVDLNKILKEIDDDNFAEKTFEVLKLFYEQLSWNSLKDSFSSLGEWDAITFALSLVAIFATAATAFLLNVGLLVASFIKLIYDITQCDTIMGTDKPISTTPAIPDGTPKYPYKINLNSIPASSPPILSQDYLLSLFNAKKDIAIDTWNGHWVRDVYLPKSGVPNNATFLVKVGSEWSVRIHYSRFVGEKNILQNQKQAFVFSAITKSPLTNPYVYSLNNIADAWQGLKPSILNGLFKTHKDVAIKTWDGHWVNEGVLT